MTVGERLKTLRKEKGISVDKLAEIIGKDRATIYRYESSEIEKMPTSVLEPLCKALNTTPSYLMGWEEAKVQEVVPLPQDNVFMIPIYDSVAAGFGVIAQDCVVSYLPTYLTCPSEKDQYLWVNVKGDSMAPLIDHGSKILIKKQTSVDSGSIAVVLVDDEEAVVKKVIYGDTWVELHSTNPYYPPRRFENNQLERIQVLGLVKEVSKSL